MKLSLDNWTGNRVTFSETPHPTPAQVLGAVHQLDGKVHTEVSLTRDAPDEEWESLTISGGPDYFLVSGEARDGSFVQLTTPGAPTGQTVSLVCGGQLSEFALRDIVTGDKILAVIQQFFDGLSNSLPAPWVVEVS